MQRPSLAFHLHPRGGSKQKNPPMAIEMTTPIVMTIAMTIAMSMTTTVATTLTIVIAMTTTIAMTMTISMTNRSQNGRGFIENSTRTVVIVFSLST